MTCSSFDSYGVSDLFKCVHVDTVNSQCEYATVRCVFFLIEVRFDLVL